MVWRGPYAAELHVVEPRPERLDAAFEIALGNGAQTGFGHAHPRIGSGLKQEIMQAGTAVKLCCSIPGPANNSRRCRNEVTDGRSEEEDEEEDHEEEPGRVIGEHAAWTPDLHWLSDQLA